MGFFFCLYCHVLDTSRNLEVVRGTITWKSPILLEYSIQNYKKIDIMEHVSSDSVRSMAKKFPSWTTEKATELDFYFTSCSFLMNSFQSLLISGLK